MIRYMLGTIRLGNKRSYSEHKPDGTEVVIPIDRPNVLGNPYVKNDRRTRAESIGEFSSYLESHFHSRKGPVYGALCSIIEHVLNGRDVILMCWCHPLNCHGQVIKQLVESAVNPVKSKPVRSEQ